LRDRNFAVGVLTMFVIGFALYGSVLLLPVFLQQLLGYTATLAGMALSPGGFFTLLMMPIAGTLVGRVQARYLLIVGMLIVAYSLFYMAGYTLQISFWQAAMGRIIQAAGLAFLFVPINAVAFYFIPKELTGQGTAIINLVRNMGGSTGIAFVTTVLARELQAHQSLLVHNLTPLNPVYEQAVSGLQAVLTWRGVNPTQAHAGALQIIYNALLSQAAIQAYTDVFRLLGIVCLMLIPCMFLLKKIKQGPGGVPAMH
jgi:DHA2 family multidrug resistance protein